MLNLTFRVPKVVGGTYIPVVLAKPQGVAQLLLPRVDGSFVPIARLNDETLFEVTDWIGDQTPETYMAQDTNLPKVLRREYLMPGGLNWMEVSPAVQSVLDAALMRGTAVRFRTIYAVEEE